ncbi:MAG TPA: hypothetical protein PKY59_20240 [Pyrinomonadaceae bacterium]|nr:hypothetical protein [Pyrinomonadaceae bacterium]
MKRAIINSITNTFALVLFLGLISFSAFAQSNEAEAVSNSELLGVSLPANALKVFPEKIPAEVNETLDKVVSGGNGQLKRGDAEVIVWDGVKNQTKTNQLVSSLKKNFQADGWTLELGGEQDGVAIFTLLKEGNPRRAVIGFYGTSDGTFVLAMSELFKNGEEVSATEETPSNETTEEKPVSAQTNGSMRDLVGKWERKESGMSSYKNGNYQGSSGNYESYTFFADGRVEYSSLIAVQNYGCRLEAFSSRKGRASLSGGKLNVNLTSGTVIRDDSCSKSKNYRKPMDSSSESYKWTIETDSSGNKNLVLTEKDGKNYYYRKTK